MSSWWEVCHMPTLNAKEDWKTDFFIAGHIVTLKKKLVILEKEKRDQAGS